MVISVVQYGLGPIGMESIKLCAERSDIRLVGAIDIDPEKVNKDLGELSGVEALRGIIICNKPDKVFQEARPDVVLHTTVSSLAQASAQLEEIINAGINVVSTTEELSYPWYHNPKIAEKLDKLAKDKSVRVLGTGVNPGFVMDELVITLASVCRKVNKVQVKRILDAGQRRGPLQRKVGAGITEQEFLERVENKKLGHVGLVESIAFIAEGIGWKLDAIKETIEPVISNKDIKTDFVEIRKGQVAGIKQIAVGMQNERNLINLELQMFVGAEESIDEIFLEGIPNLHTRIENGTPGDIATVSKLINSIPRVLQGSPGLLRPLKIKVG